MCTNQRYIYNPYSCRKVLVPCGHCPACLQKKAVVRSNRIRNNVTDGTVTLFITLTYTNDYVPYIRRSDLLSDSLDVPVLRNGDVRLTFSRFRGLRQTNNLGIREIDKVFVPTQYRNDSDVKNLSSLKGLSSDCIGVCYNPDFQNFIKRLKITLHRKGYEKSNFSYFYCSEYGGYSQRPHFHALLFIPKDDEALFRDTIVTCWPYADSNRTKKYVELARDAASYVSSYVNSNAMLYPTLSLPKFKSSHHYSKDFGVFLDCFSLRSLLEQVDRGTLYYFTRKKFDGDTAVTALPIPIYVINRYFPRHKGFNWFTTSDLQRILLAPECCGEILQSIANPRYHFTPKETYRIYVNLQNAYQRFYNECGLSRMDYAIYYDKIWRLHSSLLLKDSHKDVLDYGDFYTNSNDYVNGFVHAPTLDGVDCFVLNPNELSDVVQSSQRLTTLFYKLDKQKKVTNYCMTNNGHNV